MGLSPNRPSVINVPVFPSAPTKGNKNLRVEPLSPHLYSFSPDSIDFIHAFVASISFDPYILFTSTPLKVAAIIFLWATDLEGIISTQPDILFKSKTTFINLLT